MGRSTRKRKASGDISPAPPPRRSPRLLRSVQTHPTAQSYQTEPTAEAESDKAIDTSTKPAPSEKSQEFPYEMRLAISPPSRIAAGVALTAPLVVTFDASKLREGRSSTDEPDYDVSGLWTFLSLMSEDGRQSLAPPGNQSTLEETLMMGKHIDSVHPTAPPDPEQEPEDENFAWASFPEITITRPGRYCFKISVIDINNNRNQVLREFNSDAFDVIEGSNHDALDDKTGDELARLRSIGVNV